MQLTLYLKCLTNNGKIEDCMRVESQMTKTVRRVSSRLNHSQHCHIDGYPTIHLNFGESIELPGACLKLLCKQFDLFEAINTCESEPNSKPNVEFATALVKGQKCPK
ncbi:tbc1 domain family member gtpase-activating protein [Holotrichia oblita]|uniref:Tbc1 domain family member gtpase-activating protein n=1 Tax=Holotrichia oblita TaxID=644536 RepID=A0ACB9TWD0_HOLOL|nr:tbc1 domain family member gtpase-activating protein [Holotrichia oblita]